MRAEGDVFSAGADVHIFDGLDKAEGEALAKRLDDVGFQGTEVDTMRVGRHDYLMVTARQPE